MGILKVTKEEVWLDPIEEDLEKIYDFISKSNDLITVDRLCFVFGHGKQTNSNYRSLSELQGVEILWKDFYGPSWLKPMGFIIAGAAGLLKLNKPEYVSKSLRILSELSMVCMFSVDSSFEDEIINYVKDTNYRRNEIEKFIKKDASHFSITIDGDNVETESGYFLSISYGTECPESLKEIINNLGKYGYLGGNG